MTHRAPLTPEELRELQRLEKAATPGPWHFRCTDDAHAMNARFISTEPGPLTKDGRVLHDGVMRDTFKDVGCVAVTLYQLEPRIVIEDDCWDENGELIVALRNLAPRLFAELLALREENERQRFMLSEIVDAHDWCEMSPSDEEHRVRYQRAIGAARPAPAQEAREG